MVRIRNITDQSLFTIRNTASTFRYAWWTRVPITVRRKQKTGSRRTKEAPFYWEPPASLPLNRSFFPCADLKIEFIVRVEFNVRSVGGDRDAHPYGLRFTPLQLYHGTIRFGYARVTRSINLTPDSSASGTRCLFPEPVAVWL